jgi:hypothetical protein
MKTTAALANYFGQVPELAAWDAVCMSANVSTGQ